MGLRGGLQGLLPLRHGLDRGPGALFILPHILSQRSPSSTLSKKMKLVEVGKRVEPSTTAYKAGQMFIHRVFSYRGVLLYHWDAKVYDKDNNRPVAPSPDAPVNGQELQGTTQTYYKALIDNQDRPFLKMPYDEGFTLLSADESDVTGRSQSLYTVRGIDFVGHADVMPIQSRIPIQHDLFSQFFTEAAAEEEPGFLGNRTLQSWRSKYQRYFDVSTINRETTEGIRVTVIPFYIGVRDSRNSQDHFWQYTVRLENVGTETVTLRERLWKVFSISGTLENVAGRGVVGYEPTLSPQHPAFQYSSHVSLKAPSGHMWGEFLMETESGKHLRVKIPPFTLDSVPDSPAPPPPPQS